MSTGNCETLLHLMTTFLFQLRFSGEPERMEPKSGVSCALTCGEDVVYSLDPVFFLDAVLLLPGASPAVIVFTAEPGCCSSFLLPLHDSSCWRIAESLSKVISHLGCRFQGSSQCGPAV